MKINACKTNHIVNPIGYDLANTSVSWIVTEAKSKFQKEAQVIVALEEDMNQIVFDTGRDSKLSSLGVFLDFERGSRTRYYWKVTVWGDSGEEGESEVNYFETGKMGEPWLGEWITPDFDGTDLHPY